MGDGTGQALKDELARLERSQRRAMHHPECVVRH
jgi:hypothetical protein